MQADSRYNISMLSCIQEKAAGAKVQSRRPEVLFLLIG